MQCPQCRTDNREGRKFCAACGAALALPCPDCGFANEPDERFCGGCGTNLAGEAAETPPPAPAAAAERRQLTVLFCDLVGSTALSAALDPEDMRDVLRAYQDACASVIARYDGYVAKFMGDGVYAYFGYPRAHEDDAERAINAGLGIVEAVTALDGDRAVRIGIATGTVAVGDIVGEGASEEANVVGEAPNLAARLQEIAEPNAVVIGAATHTLAAGLFETSSLGDHALKGFTDPVGAWKVERVRRAESRFEATHGEHLAELVGRDEEVEILLRRWQRAKAGEGQVVMISGEPGIGKSRLVHALAGLLADEPHRRLGIQCSPYHANSSLHPFIEHLERIIGLETDDAPDKRLDKLVSWIAEADQSPEEIAPLLGPYFGIDATDRYPPPNVSPQRQKELVLEAIAERQTRMAARQPGLFVVEDAHWIDPTSLELLGLHVERARNTPIMIVITYRPEFDCPWVGQPQTTLMALNRLGHAQCVALAQSVGGGRSASRDIFDRIADRTDGVPLFVEELTKAVMESGAPDDGGGSRAGGFPATAIPSTLQDALEARIDKLGDARDLAQIASVIGRSFSHDVLARVSGLAEDGLRRGLDRLVRSELVFRRGEPPDATYTFKHALVQDTAYNSLLRGRRVELHARIAKTLEERFPEKVGAEPELLARHYTEAGQTGPAIDCWHRAGRVAADRFANTEAIDHFNRALDMLAGLPEGPDRARRELEVQKVRAPTLMAVHGFSGEECRQAYERVQELSVAMDDPETLFGALWGLWMINHSTANHDEALRLVDEMLDLADRRQDDDLRLQGHHAAWGGPFDARYESDLDHIERGLALYDPARHVAMGRRFGGHDAGVCGLAHAALALWALGRPDQAMDRCRKARALAEEIAYPPAVTQANGYSSWLSLFARDWPETRRYSEAAIEIGRECGALPFVAMALPINGLALVRLGKTESGLATIDEGRAMFGGRQHPTSRPFTTALRAEALGASGNPDEAIPLLDEALTLAEQLEARSCEPNVYTLKGEMLLALSPDQASDAETCFRMAIESAQRQNGKMWELRAATSLARLWHSQGKAAKAQDLLAPVYGWFTEGFDTADLKDAKALLDRLT